TPARPRSDYPPSGHARMPGWLYWPGRRPQRRSCSQRARAPARTSDRIWDASPIPAFSVRKANQACSWRLSRRPGNELQDPSRGQVLLIDPHAEGRERVLDGVHYRGRRDEHAALAHAAEIDVGVEWHGLEVRYLDPGNVTGGRHQVVHECG